MGRKAKITEADKEPTPRLTTVGIARFLALIEGLEIITSDARFTDDKLDAEALADYVQSKRADKLAMDLNKRGFGLIDARMNRAQKFSVLKPQLGAREAYKAAA